MLSSSQQRARELLQLLTKMQWREKKILAINFMKYDDFMKSKTIELAGEYQIIHNNPPPSVKCKLFVSINRQSSLGF